ncbi:MAG TPA: hypothetical protein VFC39_13315 [Acidobacteriaceae bacterium]|nr:hypothetical protein [Acidobacteriaceae bacterium]
MGIPSVGDKVYLVVAQRPFEATRDDGVVSNQFCSLVPISFEDYSPAQRTDFPENGQIWWMLLNNARQFAEPGRVLSARIESARDQRPGRSMFQVDIRTVSPVRENELVEILHVTSASVSTPRDLVSLDQVISINRPPTDRVLVRWKDRLYGPFRTESTESESGYEFGISLRPCQSDFAVHEIPAAELKKLGKDYLGIRTAVVSTTARNVDEGVDLVECIYDLITGRGAQILFRASVAQHKLLPNRDIVMGLAGQLFSRKEKQQLGALLDKLKEVVEGHASYVPKGDDKTVLDAVRQAVHADDGAVQELAVAILQSGAIDKDVKAEIDARASRYLDENAARLQAEVNDRVGALETVLKQLEEQRSRLEDELESARKRSSNELENELKAERSKWEEEQRATKRAIAEQKAQLEQQRSIVRDHLTEVTQKLSTASNELINQFLAIAPLVPHLLGSGARETISSVEPTHTAAEAPPPLAMPAAVLRQRSGTDILSEAEFFNRFEAHVQSSGFRHRRRDLVAFHLSVIGGDLTILSGPPGIGKSTLPSLYQEAAAGDETDRRQSCYLRVSVSPSWLDSRDLLGHVNALERSFQPSESGLVQQLIFAATEHALHGVDSGIHLVCLDEMNLAQVEHYFSSFMPLIEHYGTPRTLRLFAVESVDHRTVFAPWANLDLPPTLRFSGTVNLDETTRPLSQRLLDRANVVRLRPPNVTSATDSDRPSCKGASLTLRQLRQWNAAVVNLDKRIAGMLDSLSPHLVNLGCPLTPRRSRAIARFICSAPAELCSADEALDMQITQRLLPQIQLRGLFRRESRAAFEKLLRLLSEKGGAFAESVLLMEEIRDDERQFGSALQE